MSDLKEKIRESWRSIEQKRASNPEPAKPTAESKPRPSFVANPEPAKPRPIFVANPEPAKPRPSFAANSPRPNSPSLAKPLESIAKPTVGFLAKPSEFKTAISAPPEPRKPEPFLAPAPRPKAFLPERKRLPALLAEKSRDEIYQAAWLEGWNAAQKKPVAPNLQVPEPKRISLADTIQQATGPAVPITSVLPTMPSRVVQSSASLPAAMPAALLAAMPAAMPAASPAMPAAMPALPSAGQVTKLTSGELHSALLYWLDLLTDETKSGCMEVAKSIANDMNVKLAVMRERGQPIRNAMPFPQPPNTMDEFRAGLETVPADELQAYLAEYSVVPKVGSDRKSLLEQLQLLEAMGSIDQFEAHDRETKVIRPPGLA